MSTEHERNTETVDVPKGVSFSLDGRRLVAKGPLGSVVRPFPSDALELSSSPGHLTVTLRLPAHRKRSQALLRTWVAHLRNLSVSLTLGVEACLRVVAAHFPMKVQVKENHILIENFLGEKHPRSSDLLPGTSAKVEGEFVILSGFDMERVGQSAANIERASRIREYDPRVFQDGIYLVERAHLKEVA